MGLGAMREQLVILSRTPRAIGIASLTCSGTTATVTTVIAHEFSDGDYVTMAGAVPTGYNGRVQITVTGATTFTYTVTSGLTTPATGTKTVTYLTDAQGGVKATSREVARIFAELIPQRASEGIQAGGIGGQRDLQFKTHVRADILESMAVQWTPTYPPDSQAQALEIHGILPFGDGRTFMLMDVGGVR